MEAGRAVPSAAPSLAPFPQPPHTPLAQPPAPQKPPIPPSQQLHNALHAPKVPRPQNRHPQSPRQIASHPQVANSSRTFHAQNSRTGQGHSRQSPRQGPKSPRQQSQNSRQVAHNQKVQNSAQPGTTPQNELSPRSEFHKVYVSGFPNHTAAADLVRSFARCGLARVDKFNPRHSHAVLAFNTEDEAKAAIQTNKKIVIYGEFLHVRKYDSRDKPQNQNQRLVFPKSKEKGTIVAPAEIDLSGDFHQQVEQILNSVRLTQEEATLISALYRDVETVLQEQWPGCIAMPFGSITTGLGIKSSDADCFVQLQPRHQRPGDFLVNRAKRLLQAHPEVFSEILSIPRANTPIVKFYHLPTNTNCDLSFKTPLGTQNSKLISFLLHADPRLIPMSVVIKYWAKVHGLSGTGKLTNYALTMMIIFYLQQPPKTILPSVVSLQRDRANDVIVDFWNTGFAAQKDCLPANTCRASIAELIGGFFEYYSLFNFDDMVVCPYLGQPVPKAMFKDLAQLPPEFERYKQNVNNVSLPLKFMSTMCVQDPFEQCHNVASGVSMKLATEIKAYFKFAANSYEQQKPACKEFLKTILLQKPKIVKAKAHPEYRINLFPRMVINIIPQDWKSIIRETVFDVFEKMLNIKLGKVEEKLNSDSKKEKEKYKGAVTKALWRRKQFAKMYNAMNLDLITKQAKITEDVIKFETYNFECHFQTTLTFTQEPRSAVVAIKLTTGNIEAFNEFGRFFISVIQNWFMQLLKPHSAPAGPETKSSIQETIKLLDKNLERSEGIDSDSDSDDAPKSERDKGPTPSVDQKEPESERDKGPTPSVDQKEPESDKGPTPSVGQKEPESERDKGPTPSMDQKAPESERNKGPTPSVDQKAPESERNKGPTPSVDQKEPENERDKVPPPAVDQKETEIAPTMDAKSKGDSP